MEQLVVNVQRQRQLVRGFMPILLSLEVEQAGVVPGVGFLEKLAKAGIDPVAVDEGAEASVVFDAAALADAQENDPVNNTLDGEVKLALGELGVAEGEVAGQVGAPGFDSLKELFIDVAGAALALNRFSELVERAFEHRIPGEDARDFIPAPGVFGVRNV